MPIEIIDYHPSLAPEFASLNYEWLHEFFEVEPHDQEMLDNPEAYIIQPGGQIFFSKMNEEIIGTVALIADGDGVFELAKMAVTQKSRGLGIGKLLMERAIAYGRQVNARMLYLDSNSRLTPALHLYEKFGFVHKPICGDTPYQRCDVHMELILKH